jgi:hypothetical protein
MNTVFEVDVNQRAEELWSERYEARSRAERHHFLVLTEAELPGAVAALKCESRRTQAIHAAKKERGDLLTRTIRSLVRAKPDITVGEVLRRLSNLPVFTLLDSMDHPVEKIGDTVSILFGGSRGVEQTVSIESLKYRVLREKKKVR